MAESTVHPRGTRIPLRACFENISGGLAAGRGVWLRCSSVIDFPRICALLDALPAAPPRSQSLPDLFSKHGALSTLNCMVLVPSLAAETHLSSRKIAQFTGDDG